MKILFSVFSFLFCLATLQAKDKILKPGEVVGKYGFAQCLIYVPQDQTTEQQDAFFKSAKGLLSSFEHAEEVKEAKGEKSVSIASYVADCSENYKIPARESLRYYTYKLTESEGESLLMCKSLYLLQVRLNKGTLMHDYHQFISALYKLAGASDGFIWDSESRMCFSASSWQARRLDKWDYPRIEAPMLSDHFHIHAYRMSDEAPGCRAITLGLGKFGLPDLSVEDFLWSEATSVQNLLNAIAQQLLEDDVINTPNKYLINPRGIKNKIYKEWVDYNLEDNAEPNVPVKLWLTPIQDGDNENVLLKVTFDYAEGENLHERQAATLSSVFGWVDNVSMIKHDEAIEKASAEAKKRLPTLLKDFNENKLGVGSWLMVKAPFARDSGGDEWMWVEVSKWQDGRIEGLLKNQPFDIKQLSAGSKVTIKECDVFDYILSHSDGRREGNETGKLIQKQDSKRKK